ncbi:hypothetical protein G7Y89_g7204 [Cudoniella acicularis]|uniref:Mitochondrial inner membrane magnesium transporter MRS2 n=1 Tax=Cudoniella acicularis TaxID=354080 RepID=A0A8H4RIY3_9HELO|nr:hypothetical protein G7Y89_g7204 [Cudoniella acicularis]
MELTPIKIPGKRSRDTTNAGKEARRALKRAPGRPFKTDTKKDSFTNQAANTHKKSLRQKKPKRTATLSIKASPLEKLPTELLREIYFQSMNLNLPRSSLIIGTVLSSETVYNWTILFAFGLTWEKWHSKTRRIGDDSPNDQSELQEFYVADGPLSNVYSKLRRHGFKNRHLIKTLGRIVSINSLNRLPKISATAEEYFNADFGLFYRFTAQHYVEHFAFHSDDANLEQRTEIPESLLLGPWDINQIRFLFWVVKSGARIDWFTSVSGETALTGFKNAISTGDTRAILLLGWAGVAQKIDEEIMIWTLENSGGDKLGVFNHLLLLGGRPLRPDDLPSCGRDDSGDTSVFSLGRAVSAKAAAQPKLRCTELDENGNVALASGEFKKSELIAKYGLLPRDLRKIDSSLLPHILVRPSAILINLLHLRVLIKANRVLVFDAYGSIDSYNQSAFIYDLEDKLRQKQNSPSAGGLPYEFRALEAVLVSVITSLETEFEGVREPVVRVLRDLEEDIDRDKLRLLLIYSKKLGTFEQKAKLVRDSIDELLEADDDLAAMYLTEKSHDLVRGEDDHTEVEMLLESYHKLCDEIVQESGNLVSNIRNTEEIVKAILDANRNSLMLLDLKFSIGTLGIGTGAFIAALYGMNLKNFIEESELGFWGVTGWSLVFSTIVCGYGLTKLRKVQRVIMRASHAATASLVGAKQGGIPEEKLINRESIFEKSRISRYRNLSLESEMMHLPILESPGNCGGSASFVKTDKPLTHQKEPASGHPKSLSSNENKSPKKRQINKTCAEEENDSLFPYHVNSLRYESGNASSLYGFQKDPVERSAKIEQLIRLVCRLFDEPAVGSVAFVDTPSDTCRCQDFHTSTCFNNSTAGLETTIHDFILLPSTLDTHTSIKELSIFDSSSSDTSSLDSELNSIISWNVDVPPRNVSPSSPRAPYNETGDLNGIGAWIDGSPPHRSDTGMHSFGNFRAVVTIAVS